MKEVLETHAVPISENKDAYKAALEIILALCEKMDYKSSDISTVETICKTVLQKEV